MKSLRLQIRVSEEEHAHLVRKAEENKMSLSDYVRRKLIYTLPVHRVEGEAPLGFPSLGSILEQEASKEAAPAQKPARLKPKLCSRCRHVGEHQKECKIPGCGPS